MLLLDVLFRSTPKTVCASANRNIISSVAFLRCARTLSRESLLVVVGGTCVAMFVCMTHCELPVRLGEHAYCFLFAPISLAAGTLLCQGAQSLCMGAAAEAPRTRDTKDGGRCGSSSVFHLCAADLFLEMKYNIVVVEASVGNVLFLPGMERHFCVVIMSVRSVDGRDVEKMIARTMLSNDDRCSPRWEESFSLSVDQTLRWQIKLFSHQALWPDALCGTASLAVCDGMAFESEKRQVDLILKSGGDDVGTLKLITTPEVLDNDWSSALSSMHDIFSLPPGEFKTRMEFLLNRPQLLEEVIRCRFKQLSTAKGSGSQPSLDESELEAIVDGFAQVAGVCPQTLGSVDQLFWNFEFSGDGVLYEPEAVRAALYILRLYRDAENPVRSWLWWSGQMQHGPTEENYLLLLVSFQVSRQRASCKAEDMA